MSPTKQMDFNSDLSGYYKETSNSSKFDDLYFRQEALLLNNILKELEPEALSSLMKLSPSLSVETHRNIQSFTNPQTALRPALFAYNGTVFKALAPESLNQESIDYARRHLRIISGLYGLLKPMDYIAPYRLEMKTRVNIPGEGSLSSFWRSRITPMLCSEDALTDPRSAVINLASAEYSRIVEKKRLNRKVINFHFKERTGQGLKIFGMYSKLARGLMLRRILIERIKNPEALQSGSTGGWVFDSALSSPCDWLFVRGEL